MPLPKVSEALTRRVFVSLDFREYLRPKFLFSTMDKKK